MAKRVLDGELVFRKYWEMGRGASWLKVKRWFETQGYVSSTGQPYLRMTLWKSAWRWAVQNSEKAYGIVQETLVQYNDSMSKVEWEQELIEKGATAFQNLKYYRALKKHIREHGN